VQEDDAAREALLDLLTRARAAGARVAYDGNYRPRLWPDAATARAWHRRFLGLTDIALVTADDEAALHDATSGQAALEATMARLAAAGVAERVVKLGAEGALVAGPGQPTPLRAPTPQSLDPVDTTGAGDAFNGAFLAARLGGANLHAAALAGHALAGRVVMRRGAVLPRADAGAA
jgi:2-dehydro-3-deoxygluconokinase